MEDTPASSLNGRFRLGWDAQGLVVLVGVKDDHWQESAAADSIYGGDSIELFVTTNRDKGQFYQALISPGMASDQPQIRYRLQDQRTNAALKTKALGLEVVRSATPGGYVLEARLPWTNLGISPREGLELGFQLYVNDRDTTDDTKQLRWYPLPGAYSDPSKMNQIRLAEIPSSPVTLLTKVEYPDFRNTRLTAIGVAEDAGKTVIFRQGTRTGSGTLATQNGRTTAEINLPMPSRAEADLPATVALGTVQSTIVTPDFADLTRQAAENLPLNFGGFVFRGTELPKPSFENPELARSVLGKFQISARYFDANAAPVTVANTPGRYGAVVTITPESGRPLRRYVTLYRRPDGPPMWMSPSGFSALLPKELGLDPAVTEAQSGFVGTQLAGILELYNPKMPELAMLLAGLGETKASDPMVDRLSADRRDERYWHQVRKRLDIREIYPYFVTTPKDYSPNSGKTYPTILFLHGAGERGANLEAVKRVGLPPAAAADPNFPFILIAPQCPEDQFWNPTMLEDLLDQVKAKYRIDPNRLYLTGLSMGGYGSWALAAEHPDLFAAVAPICGAYDPQDALQLKNTPIWAFHGESDPIVPLEGSVNMIDALKKVGAPEAKLTTYPGVGHDSWVRAYATKDLYQWFLDHVKK
jgi:pimeloyl-ACP methyl ester carboxylesterase